MIKAGGFTHGGLNFDAKARRASSTFEDIFFSYIAGMDTFALGLTLADKIITDGRLDRFTAERYASFESGIGKKILEGSATMAELEQYALSRGDVQTDSGRQEYLEALVNSLMFS